MANFIKGYTIKPKEITAFGKVIFQDESGAICNANQITCEAYGYRFNKTRGVCMAYLPQNSGLVNTQQRSQGNSKSGVGNEIENGGQFNDINGVENTIKENVQNSQICGVRNEIQKDLVDVSVIGEYGKGLRDGEQVYGGGNYQYTNGLGLEGCGYAQSSVIQFTGFSTDTVEITMLVLGRGNLILQTNCVLGFEVRFTTLDQLTGAYVYYTKRGTIFTDDNNEATICISEADVICSSGEICDNYFSFVQLTEGEGEETIYGDIEMRVTGCDDNDTLHHATMDIHETRTNTTI